MRVTLSSRTDSTTSSLDKPEIKEMLQIMDIAAEIRRATKRAKDELRNDELRVEIIKSLKATAALTNEALSDAEIESAIDSYFEQRFSFRPAPKGWKYTLLCWYCQRQRLYKPLALLFSLLALCLLVSSVLSSAFSPASAKSSLPALLDSSKEHTRQVHEIAGSQKTKELASALLSGIERAAARGDATEAKAGHTRLEQLLKQLESDYEIHIVSRPGVKSGVERFFHPDEVKKTVSGYYLIVEAVNADGTFVKVPIKNVETSEVKEVSTWAEQVSKEVFEQIRQDKSEDGIIQNSLFARKQSGQLEPQMLLKGPTGSVIPRKAQITSW